MTRHADEYVEQLIVQDRNQAEENTRAESLVSRLVQAKTVNNKDFILAMTFSTNCRL